MNFGDKAVSFSCEGDQLIGVVSVPEQPEKVGLIAVVAGGPQYRAGVGRILVQLSRHLATEGIATFRFDYRGTGDSEGNYRGFQTIESDLKSAVAEFKAQVPEVEKIVFWGAVMLHPLA